MTWNDVVASVKEKFRRGLGRRSRHEVQLADSDTRLEPLGDAPLGAPAVDVYENEKEFLVHADVPGGMREGATVAWDEARGLTFVVKCRPLPPGTLWASEYTPCEWYRALELPAYVDGSNATCTLKDGVLTIRVPKRSATSRPIPVKAG